MKTSLRELVIVISFLGIGFASLRVGGVMASLMIFAGSLFVMALGIMALVAKNKLRAYSIGFLLPMLVYAATLVALGSKELDPYHGSLPTTKALRYVRETMLKETWNLKEWPYVLEEFPDRTTFTTVAHLMFAVSLGWVGSKFAVYIYRIGEPKVASVNQK